MAHSVRDVLYKTVAAPHVGYGSEALVFDFPKAQPALQPFMLRHFDTFEPAWLGYTTHLTPVKHLVGGMNVGQPLLELDGQSHLTVMARQPGICALAWKKAESEKLAAQGIGADERTYRTEMAFVDLMVDFKKHNANPFIKIFDETYRLGMLGYGRDSADGNIFIDTATRTLGLVDQLGDRKEPSALRAKNNIGAFIKDSMLPELTSFDRRVHDEDFIRDYDRHRAVMTQMLEEARAIVLARHTAPDAPPIAFAKVDSVEAIALDSPPHVLVDALNRITSEANIPTR